MIQDLHSHTYYSFCGSDTPEAVVEAAICGGIDMIGITDHAHGVGEARLQHFQHPLQGVEVDYERTTRRYFDHINLIKEKYADRIKVLRGIEVATVKKSYAFPEKADISFFDYCIVEHLDYEETIFITFSECLAYTGPEHLTRRVETLISAMQATNRISSLIHYGNVKVLETLPHIPRVILGGVSEESTLACIETLAGENAAKGVMTYKLELN